MKAAKKSEYVELQGWLLLSDEGFLLRSACERVDYVLTLNEGDKKRAKKLKGEWVVVLGNVTGRIVRVNSLHK